MRKLGWGLIMLFGGGILYLLMTVLYEAVSGQNVQGETTTELLIVGMLAVLAAIPVALGVILVRTHPVVPEDQSNN